MEFGKAFSYQFEDQDWIKKILIAAVIPLIPIVGSLIAAGWGVEITKRVIRHDPQPLAEWDDFGGYLAKGFKLIIIGLVYALPLIIVSICPTILLTAPYSSNGNSETLIYVAYAATACFGLIFLLYGILLAFLIPAAIGRFADTGQLGAAFKFREVFALVKATPMAFLMVFLGTIVSGFIASLGSIACGVGVLATTAYATSINAHLQGQAYLEATSKTSSY